MIENQTRGPEPLTVLPLVGPGSGNLPERNPRSSGAVCPPEELACGGKVEFRGRLSSLSQPRKPLADAKKET